MKKIKKLMFASPVRPFYQSVTLMNIGSIPLDEYNQFAQHHFKANGKGLEADVVPTIYHLFNEVTWYMQKILNELYFIKTHHLDSASSVQKASQVLLSKQIITQNAGSFELYDKFMALWLRKNMIL